MRWQSRGLTSILFAQFVLEDYGVFVRDTILTVPIVAVSSHGLLQGARELPARHGIVRPREHD